jgi:predicted  nucleic acid-binding Zn-ribbon protein
VDGGGEQPGGDTLNAPLADQWRLLDLQALDSRLDQLAHRRRSLPEHAEIQDTTVRLAQVRDLLVAAQTEESDLAREQLKGEADVDQVRARAERDRTRLDAGQVGSPRELESLQHEIETLGRRQAALEDAVLDIMERRESAQARVAALTAERDRLESALQSAEQRRDAAIAELDAEAGTVRGERASLAKGLPADLLALYEKLREQHDGVGAAALRRGRCEGCRIELSTTDLAAIKAKPEDAVVRCEQCRRILVRVADSGL